MLGDHPFITATQVLVIENGENSLLIQREYICTGNTLLLEMIRYLNNTPVLQV